MTEWISVEDRLPEHGQLVSFTYGKSVLAGEFYNPELILTIPTFVSLGMHHLVIINKRNWNRSGITHWQPIEPPKGES